MKQVKAVSLDKIKALVEIFAFFSASGYFLLGRKGTEGERAG
jgi:hypothetical protein